MMSKKLFLALLLTAIPLLNAVEPAPSNILSQTAQPSLGIVELKLNNGMRVCLKPTAFDEDEVLIRFTARGGYADLPPDQRASGELAAQVAWESGLEGVSTDKLSALIYEHAIELYGKVMPYHRVIEGTTDVGGIECFFDLAKRYSTQKHFTREGFERVICNNREMIQAYERARLSPFEEWSRLVHTQEVAALKPLSLQDLSSMDFDRAKQFFEDYFSNPADFVCVIVGNFEVEKIVPLVSSYLGAIPIKNATRQHINQPPQFPEGVWIKRIPACYETESLASLTFPLAPIKDPKQLHFAKLIAQVLETRLRAIIDQQFGICLSASLELPLYPGLHLTWLSIQYRAPQAKIEAIKNRILDEINRALRDGPSEDELSCSWKLLRQKDELWQQDNQYWLSLLSDHLLRGWDWQEVQKAFSLEPAPGSGPFKEIMQTFLYSDHFSFIYTMPN